MTDTALNQVEPEENGVATPETPVREVQDMALSVADFESLVDREVATSGLEQNLAPELKKRTMAGIAAIMEQKGDEYREIIASSERGEGIVVRLIQVDIQNKIKTVSEMLLLEEEASRDPLTKAFNRRVFFEFTSKFIQAAERKGQPLSVLMVDLDNFKKINDNYGHQVGDAVLTEIVKRIGKALREADMIGRYGGDEFIVLLPETDGEGAQDVAQRVLQEVMSEAFVIDGIEIPVSITLGAGEYNPSEGDSMGKKMAGRADKSLLAAKRGGKARVGFLEKA